MVECSVDLIVGSLKGDSVHDVAVEAVIEGFIEVIAGFVVFESLAQHSGEQVKRVSTEMTTGLSDNGVSERVVFCRLQSLDGLAVEVGRGEPSSDIHDRHLVPIVAADLEALAGEVDSFVEG